jgi:hypothetical protein
MDDIGEIVLQYMDVAIPSAPRRDPPSFWKEDKSAELGHERDGDAAKNEGKSEYKTDQDGTMNRNGNEEERSYFSDSEHETAGEAARRRRQRKACSRDRGVARSSRCKASAYSATSVLDDKTREAQKRFVWLAQALPRRGSKSDAVPPLPQLPEMMRVS